MNSSLSALQPINRRARAFLILAVLWLCAPYARPAAALTPPYVSLWEGIKGSDVIVTGTFHDLRQGRARFAVTQVLKGEAASDIEIAPVRTRPQRRGDRTFREGETCLLFLTPGAGATMLREGHSARTLPPKNSGETVEAVRRLIPLAAMEASVLARAMFALVADANPVLRNEALFFVEQLSREREGALQYKAEWIALLGSPDRDVKWTALAAVRYRNWPEALPLVIEISRSQNADLVRAASETLGAYDAPEAVAALIALADSGNPEFRAHALRNIGRSERPIAKTVLLAHLNDPAGSVRAAASAGLVSWLRRGAAPEAMPLLIELLDDPEPQVQTGVARVIGASASPLVVAPLLRVLKRAPSGGALEQAAMISLNGLYLGLDASARPPLAPEEVTVIARVMRRNPNFLGQVAAQFLRRLNTPQALAALRESAQSDDPTERANAMGALASAIN